jgi:hypothetical protein
MALPKFASLTIDTHLIPENFPKAEIEDPTLVKLRILSEDPMVVAPNSEQVAEKRAKLLKLKPDPLLQ